MYFLRLIEPMLPTPGNNFFQLQRPLEQGHGNRQRYDPEDGQVQHVLPDRDQAGFFQQEGLEAVDCEGEWIDPCDELQPSREGLNRIDRAAREKEQSVE